jgi:hypothetical protein
MGGPVLRSWPEVHVGSSRKGSDFATARRIALGLPGVEEASSYGTPAFRVGGKLFSRFHQDGESLVVHTSFDQREALVAADPACFLVTDHYRNHPYVLVRLSAAKPAILAEVLTQAWRQRAPRRMIAAYDAATREVRRK